MNLFEGIESIIFDFDGVIIDSMKIRDLGYYEIFKQYDKDKVEELLKYHRINGGLSRFHKVKYFYNEILNKPIEEEEILKYSNEFSKIMKSELVKSEYIIYDCVEFINKNKNNFTMHIASGSEEKELNYICKQQGIDNYFKSIYGSPLHKNKLVENIIIENNYDKSKVVLVGDSINDYEAAKINGIKFIAYNNEKLKALNCYYLDNFLD